MGLQETKRIRTASAAPSAGSIGGSILVVRGAAPGGLGPHGATSRGVARWRRLSRRAQPLQRPQNAAEQCLRPHGGGFSATPAAEEAQEGELEGGGGAQRAGGSVAMAMARGRWGRGLASRRSEASGRKGDLLTSLASTGTVCPAEAFKNLPDIIVRHAPRPPSTVYSACMRCVCGAPHLQAQECLCTCYSSGSQVRRN
jgi:hypothetical protein